MALLLLILVLAVAANAKNAPNATMFNENLLDVYLEPAPFDPPTLLSHQVAVKLVEPVATRTEIKFLLYSTENTFGIPLTFNIDEHSATFEFKGGDYSFTSIGVSSASDIFIESMQFDSPNKHFAIHTKVHAYCRNEFTDGVQFKKQVRAIKSFITTRSKVEQYVASFNPELLKQHPAQVYYNTMCRRNKVIRNFVPGAKLPEFSTFIDLKEKTKNAVAKLSLLYPILFAICLPAVM